jgi:hypothetical protein
MSTEAARRAAAEKVNKLSPDVQKIIKKVAHDAMIEEGVVWNAMTGNNTDITFRAIRCAVFGWGRALALDAAEEERDRLSAVTDRLDVKLANAEERLRRAKELAQDENDPFRIRLTNFLAEKEG